VWASYSIAKNHSESLRSSKISYPSGKYAIISSQNEEKVYVYDKSSDETPYGLLKTSTTTITGKGTFL